MGTFIKGINHISLTFVVQIVSSNKLEDAQFHIGQTQYARAIYDLYVTHTYWEICHMHTCIRFIQLFNWASQSFLNIQEIRKDQ